MSQLYVCDGEKVSQNNIIFSVENYFINEMSKTIVMQ